MPDKNYKIILLGQIASGFDPQEVKEKLALIFEKSEKKIDKLFKKPKPLVIRKNLTQEIALRYKAGLEGIGVLCEIQNGQTRIAEKVPIAEAVAIPAEEFALVGMEGSFGGTMHGPLRVKGIRISWGAAFVFLIKLALAAVPALIMLGLFFYGISQFLEDIKTFLKAFLPDLG